MAGTPWHPYAPDQAFGHQAARDEELLDQAIAALQRTRAGAPRAASKAQPRGTTAERPAPAGVRMAGWFKPDAGLPVTTNVALDAATRVQSERG
jgi:hypothetical protein